MHTVFLRFHNAMAKKLKILNPHWTSNTVYLETRRLLGAITQHITYNEWLPRVIGPQYMAHYGLNSLPLGLESYYSYYDTADPSILNEFSTAAFRFGHSQVNVSHRFRRIPPQQPLHYSPYRLIWLRSSSSFNTLLHVTLCIISMPNKVNQGQFNEYLNHYNDFFLFKSMSYPSFDYNYTYCYLC